VWLRIRLSIAAYAYEFENDSIMTDAEFDKLSLEINPTVTTGNRKMDRFFETKFDPSTGSWIWTHPERPRIKSLYEKHWANRKDT
jgi:hypothetical protein